MSKGEPIFKSDRLRLMARQSIEDIRKNLMQLARGGRSRLVREDILKNADPFHVWKYMELLLRSEGRLEDSYSITMPTAAALSAGSMSPFIFQDKELVEDILESKTSGIPFSAVKFPFDEFLIELPEPVVFPDGSGDKWDVACFRYVDMVRSPYELNDQQSLNAEFGGQELESEKCIMLVCYNMSDKSGDSVRTNWLYFTPRPEFVFTDDDIVGMDNKSCGSFPKEVVGSVILQILRFVFFLVSPSCVVNTVSRSKPSVKAPDVVRYRFQQTRIVSVSKERTNYEYDEDDDSGRKVSVRFRVVGHFKHFTKGRLSGRIIWCPPHWKGPDIGVQVEKKYVVS